MRKEFLDRCSQQVAAYTCDWLAYTQKGWETDELLAKLEDLTLGVEILLMHPETPSPFQGQVVAGLTERHLMCTPIGPFTAVPFCLQSGGSSATPQHNALAGLQRVGDGGGYFHLSEELALKVAAFFATNMPTVPTVPLNVEAEGKIASILFSWQVPTSDGGSTLLRYEILRNNVPLTIVTVASGLLSYEDTTAVANTTYTYSVRAVNAVGGSPFASAAPVQTTPATVPGPPTNPVAAQTGTTQQVIASATAPTTTGGSAITGYKVYRNGSSVPLATGLATPAYTDNTVQYGVTYTYAFSATNLVGDSQKSGVATVSVVAPITTYTGTYTTTYQDSIDKCQTDVPADNVTRTETSTISQADANSKARTAAIAAITCPITYTRTISNTLPASSPGESDGIVLVAASTQRLAFIGNSTTSGNTLSLQITDSSDNSITYVSFPDDYKTTPFAFYRSNGTTYTGNFPAQDLNFTA